MTNDELDDVLRELGSLQNHMADTKAYLATQDVKALPRDQLERTFEAMYRYHISYTKRVTDVRAALKVALKKL
jgi:hypothetical protein